MTRSSEDLPQPEGPTTNRDSPGPTRRSRCLQRQAGGRRRREESSRHRLGATAACRQRARAPADDVAGARRAHTEALQDQQAARRVPRQPRGRARLQPQHLRQQPWPLRARARAALPAGPLPGGQPRAALCPSSRGTCPRSLCLGCQARPHALRAGDLQRPPWPSDSELAASGSQRSKGGAAAPAAAQRPTFWHFMLPLPPLPPSAPPPAPPPPALCPSCGRRRRGRGQGSAQQPGAAPLQQPAHAQRQQQQRRRRHCAGALTTPPSAATSASRRCVCAASPLSWSRRSTITDSAASTWLNTYEHWLTCKRTAAGKEKESRQRQLWRRLAALRASKFTSSLRRWPPAAHHTKLNLPCKVPAEGGDRRGAGWAGAFAYYR
jgi:hypothetical protein